MKEGLVTPFSALTLIKILVRFKKLIDYVLALK